MAEKDQPPGEIDFSDGELSEMGVELAGRAEAAPTPRRSRSMLRVPVDEVPRPRTGQHEAALLAGSWKFPSPTGPGAQPRTEHRA